MSLEHNQLELFSDMPLNSTRRAQTLLMSQDALVQWKSQIFDYQQRMRETKPPEQVTLFNLLPSHCNPDKIDPW